MPFEFSKLKNNPLLILAPMAGVTDQAFRQLCKNLGADITWSEMVSAHGLVLGNKEKSLVLAKKFSSGESPYIVQLFGNDPKIMAQAAKLIEQEIKPDGIDINFGCPVKKAIKAGYGAVQMKTPEEIVKTIRAVKKATSLPVSVKTRLGWTDKNALESLAPEIEKAGADMLVIHARTWKEGFRSEPHWEVIKKIKELLDIPVIHNGGVDSPERARFYLEKTGSDGIMIGQGALGRPWIFSQTKVYLKSGGYSHPSASEVKKIIISHAKLACFYNKGMGITQFRKHLGWYLRGLPGAKNARKKIGKAKTLKDVETLVDSLLAF